MQAQDEAIELLESQKQYMQRLQINPQLTEDAMKREARIDQALAKLKEEPEPSEFVKECREIRKRGASAGQWEYPTNMMEACKIIEQLHAEIKKLVEGQKG